MYGVGDYKRLAGLLGCLFEVAALGLKYLCIDRKELFAVHARLTQHPSQKYDKVGLFEGLLLVLLVENEDTAKVLVAAVVQLLLENF